MGGEASGPTGVAERDDRSRVVSGAGELGQWLRVGRLARMIQGGTKLSGRRCVARGARDVPLGTRRRRRVEQEATMPLTWADTGAGIRRTRTPASRRRGVVRGARDVPLECVVCVGWSRWRVCRWPGPIPGRDTSYTNTGLPPGWHEPLNGTAAGHQAGRSARLTNQRRWPRPAPACPTPTDSCTTHPERGPTPADQGVRHGPTVRTRHIQNETPLRLAACPRADAPGGEKAIPLPPPRGGRPRTRRRHGRWWGWG